MPWGNRVAAMTLGVLALPALAAPAAHAGGYAVRSCQIDGAFYANKAWQPVNTNLWGAAPYSEPDATCSGPGDPLVAILRPDADYGKGVTSAVRFTPPEGTLISDYTLVLRHLYNTQGRLVSGSQYRNNSAFTMVTFGAYAVSLAGEQDAGVVSYTRAEGHYLGDGGPIDTGAITISKADSPAAQRQDRAPEMEIQAGCWNNAPANCSLTPTSTAQLQLVGARVSIADDHNPALTSIGAGAGLLAPGVRNGDEPISFSASDNAGIQRAEIVDIGAKKPVVLASQDFPCDFTLPHPCTDVAGASIAAPVAVAGHRTIVLRVIDAGGNATDSASYRISARGKLNGTNASTRARLVARFGSFGARRTVAFGQRARIVGTLRTRANRPIGYAELHVLARDRRPGATFTEIGVAHTTAAGRFGYTVPAGASRTIRVTYATHFGDDELAAVADARLTTRARVALSGPKRAHVGAVARFRGHVFALPLPAAGVVVDLQARRGHGRWRTLTTRRARGDGRFDLSWRARGSSGRMVFRLRLHASSAYPYAAATSRSMAVRVAG